MFFVYAYLADLGLRDVGWHIAIGIAVEIAILFKAGLSLGGGTTKALGVGAMWLGPVENTLWFLMGSSILMLVFWAPMVIFKSKESKVPALPAILISLALTLPKTDNWQVFQNTINTSTQWVLG